MCKTIEQLANLGKKHKDHRECRQIELGRIIQKWQQHPLGPDNAPAEIKRAGLRAKETLFSENVLLLIKAFNKYKYLHSVCCISGEDDLAQDLCIGFNRGLEKYDPERGTRISTLCMWWLRQAALRHLDKNRSQISIPAARMQLMRNLQSGKISKEDISDLGLELVSCAYQALSIASFDAPLKEEGDNAETLAHCIKDTSHLNEIEDLDSPWQRFQEDHPEDAALLLALTESSNGISKTDRKQHKEVINKLREYCHLCGADSINV